MYTAEILLIQNHEYILEAALQCNKELALKAFMNDPLVIGKVSEEEGKQLLEDMIRSILDYLPDGWKELV